MNKLNELYAELGYLSDEEEDLRRELSKILRLINKVEREINGLEDNVIEENEPSNVLEEQNVNLWR